MPIIKRSAPLIEEGIYVTQARGVSTSWSKPKPDPDGSKGQSHQVFHISLFLPDGRSVKTNAHVTPKTGFVFESLARSGELNLPDGEFIITTDDLERRRLYINLRHEEFNNQKVAKVSFVTQRWAEQQNPSIVGITFNNEAPRPVDLKPASSPSSPQQEPPPAEPPSAPAIPKPPVQPGEIGHASVNLGDLETLSDEDFAQTIEQAKEQRRKKE
jgi:hypothetical protein